MFYSLVCVGCRIAFRPSVLVHPCVSAFILRAAISRLKATPACTMIRGLGRRSSLSVLAAKCDTRLRYLSPFTAARECDNSYTTTVTAAVRLFLLGRLNKHSWKLVTAARSTYGTTATTQQ